MKHLIPFILVSGALFSFAPAGKIEPSGFEQVLGQSVNSTVVQDYLLTLGEKPEKISNIGGICYYVYYAKGIDLMLIDSTVRTIFLFPEGTDEHKGYAGKCPYGLAITDTRKVVLKKLGKADKNVEVYSEHKDEWGRKGITIVYWTMEGKRSENKINYIAISKPH
jgi:hypothetical protein